MTVYNEKQLGGCDASVGRGAVRDDVTPVLDVSGSTLKRSYDALQKKLSKDQRQASRDIGLAYDDARKGFGYAALGAKSSNYALMGSGGARGTVSDFQGRVDRMRRRIVRLSQWEDECRDRGVMKWVQAVRALEGAGCKAMTARGYGKHIGVSHVTVGNWYREGLSFYCDLFYKKSSNKPN